LHKRLASSEWIADRDETRELTPPEAAFWVSRKEKARRIAASLPRRANSIGLVLRLTPLHRLGNSEVATEQSDLAQPSVSQAAAPPLQAAVVLEAASSAKGQ
jgi:hypothetical protein